METRLHERDSKASKMNRISTQLHITLRLLYLGSMYCSTHRHLQETLNRGCGGL